MPSWAVIAKRLEERARKLQETNLRVVRMRPLDGGWATRAEGCQGSGAWARGFLVPRDEEPSG